MTYYEAYTRVKKLAATAEGKDADALRMAANLLFNRAVGAIPEYDIDGEGFWCPGCATPVCPDDNFCSFCGLSLEWPMREGKEK